VLTRQPSAQAEAWEHFLGPVRRILAWRYHDVQRQHPDWIDEAAADGIAGYIGNPNTYDPEKSPLLSFLVMAAARDLWTRLRKELGPAVEDEAGEKRWVHFVSIDDDEDENVGKHLVDRNTNIEEQVMSMLADNAVVGWLKDRITDPDDWAVVQLLMHGATRTEEYVAAVGLDASGLDPKELAHRASDHKERVKKRLRRLIRAYREGRDVRAYNRRGSRRADPSSS
jgi:hypothetical protein